MTYVESVESREINPPVEVGSIPNDAHDVLVLPQEVVDGVGLYDDSAVTLVKALRAAGVSAGYQHGPEERRWIGKKGVSTIVLDVVLGIVGNAGWAGIYALLRRSGSHRVRVRITRVRHTATGSDSQWYEIEGAAHAVAATLRQLGASESAALPEGDQHREAT